MASSLSSMAAPSRAASLEPSGARICADASNYIIIGVVLHDLLHAALCRAEPSAAESAAQLCSWQIPVRGAVASEAE